MKFNVQHRNQRVLSTRLIGSRGDSHRFGGPPNLNAGRKEIGRKAKGPYLRGLGHCQNNMLPKTSSSSSFVVAYQDFQMAP
jgi:hypothetical protein